MSNARKPRKNPWLDLVKQKYQEVIQEKNLSGRFAMQEAIKRAKLVYKPIPKKDDSRIRTDNQTPDYGQEGRGPVTIA